VRACLCVCVCSANRYLCEIAQANPGPLSRLQSLPITAHLAAENKAVGVMAPGHTFTIEPMINAGTWHDEHWPDDWTAVTRVGIAALYVCLCACVPVPLCDESVCVSACATTPQAR
jgi:hypothetical protein